VVKISLTSFTIWCFLTSQLNPPSKSVSAWLTVGSVNSLTLDMITRYNLERNLNDDDVACFALLVLTVKLIGSQVLRLANVEHIIFDVICDNLWQPFLSEYLWECLGARRVVVDIYSRLAADGNQVQRNWKVSISRQRKASSSSTVMVSPIWQGNSSASMEEDAMATTVT
jgi:hypothetical protein